MVELLKEYFFTIGLTIVCLLSSFFISRLIQKNYEKYKSRDLLAYKPTVWTSIGILGTFVSIVYSLCYNQNDFRDIQLLIKNISPAFLTSIIGIVGSIVTSYKVKLLLAEEDSKLESEYQNFIANPGSITNIDKITPEMQLYSIYRNINEINESNNSKLQSIFECLNNQFGENGLFQKFQDIFFTRIELEFKNNRTALNDLLKKDGVVSLYLKEMTNKLNSTIEEKLSQINSSIDQSIGKDGLLQKSVSNDIAELKASLSSELGENGVVSKRINEGTEAIRELNKTENSISSFLNNVIGENGSLNTIIERQAKETRDSIEGMKTKLSEDLGENGEIVGKIHNAMTSITSELSTQNQKIKDFLDELIKNISEYYQQVSKETADATVNLIEKNFVDYKTIFNSYNEELSGNLANYGKELKEIEAQFLTDQNKALNDSLDSNIDNIRKRTELIEGINNSLIGVLNENKSSIESAIQSFKDDIITTIAAIQTAFVTNAKDNSDTLQNTAQELITKTIESTKNLKDILEENNQTLNTDLNSLVSSFKTSTSEMQENWVASMNTLKDAVEGQKEGLESVIKDFQELAKSNNASVSSITEYLSSNENALEEFNGHLDSIDKNIKDYATVQNEFTENYDDSINTLGLSIGRTIDESIKQFGENIEDSIKMLKGSVKETIEQNAKDTQSVVKQLTKDYSCSNKEEMELIKELKKLV